MLTNDQREKIKQSLKGIDRTSFAIKIGTSKGMANKILTGNASVSALRAKEVEKRTDGLVPAKLLRPDIFE
jgi:DNA-binding transcriptional regulator YdaS (Cro superfamily)